MSSDSLRSYVEQYLRVRDQMKTWIASNGTQGNINVLINLESYLLINIINDFAMTRQELFLECQQYRKEIEDRILLFREEFAGICALDVVTFEVGNPFQTEHEIRRWSTSFDRMIGQNTKTFIRFVQMITE